MTAVTRRRLLGWAGLSAVAGAAAAGADAGLDAARGDGDRAAPDQRVAFHGEHQAGIATPVQDRLHFAAFDLLEGTTRADLADLLRTWSDAAAALCAGRPVGGAGPSAVLEAPPRDTGEARDLATARLTVTIGLGPSLFDDRFGLRARRPAALRPLPAFPGDALDPARSDGDLAIQACADDPQVAVHAVRNLARLAHGVAIVRYSQLGFGRTSSTTAAQATPRNLLGFKDGTANLKAEDPAALREHVWVQPGDERAPLDLARTPPDAHVRLAHPDSNGGVRLLRRGYSFVDGSDDLGRLDAGLYFLAYQRDPQRQFARVQARLAGKHGDALNEYVTHVGSALFAIPPGVRGPGDWWGRALLT